MNTDTTTKKVMCDGIEYNVIVKSDCSTLDKAMNDWKIKKMNNYHMPNWIRELEELPADAKIEVPARLLELLAKHSEREAEDKHPTDCECADCEKANPLCEDCRKRPKYDDGICEKCYDILQASICDTESEEEEEEEEDSDWDGDLDDTPNCHQCGEDCGRSIIAHQKYKKTYFCSEECNREYDGEDE
jgi:hypothetical protein